MNSLRLFNARLTQTAPRRPAISKRLYADRVDKGTHMEKDQQPIAQEGNYKQGSHDSQTHKVAGMDAQKMADASKRSESKHGQSDSLQKDDKVNMARDQNEKVESKMFEEMEGDVKGTSGMTGRNLKV